MYKKALCASPPQWRRLAQKDHLRRRGITPDIVNFMLQQNIANEGCSTGPHKTNAWQETNSVYIETVIDAAERRHPEVVQDLAAAAEQNHR